MVRMRRDGLRSNERGGALICAAALGLALATASSTRRCGRWRPTIARATGRRPRAPRSPRASSRSTWRGAPVPSYDAGLARGRCGDADASRALFEAALARDPSFFPARSALVRAQAASGAAGLDRAIVDVEAQLVASRFTDVNALVLLGTLQINLPRAVTELGEARRLDPASFEAQMSFAALNLGFHGYAPAEEAYRAALTLRPDDYDARLGLSLSLRAQIDEVRGPALVPEAERELVEAKSLAPDRPEAYFNEGILAQEYGGRWGDEAERANSLVRARDLFTTFLAKAGDGSAFADARKRASAHLVEIDVLSRFGSEGRAIPRDPQAPESEPE